jgi:arylsulfatase
VPAGNHLLGLRMRREKGRNVATLLIDGQPAGGFDEPLGFVSFISWSGLDIGRDRSSPVSHYEAPFAFTGKLRKVTFTLDDDQALDAKAAATAALARE